MGILARLMDWGRERRDRRKRDATRKLSPAMPMAAAGAELSVSHEKSETEQNLERATGATPKDGSAP